MLYQLLIYCILITDTYTDKNSTDVFVTYSGHSEIERPVREKPETVTRDTKSTEEPFTDVTESVVFIPNKPVLRNGDFNGVVRDLIETRNDLTGNDKIHITETDSPKEGILFISGKNREQKPPESRKQEHKESRRGVGKLDCINLDCNNTINSVCGSKEENKKMKYRLFLNECFFRKVNCGFQHKVNRYSLVPVETCKYTGAHFLSKPYVFKPIPLPELKKTPKTDTRRSFYSRRSLNMGVDGSFCSHSCPVYCTEDYDPQCVVSSSGQRRVFLNHCKLDYNSCLYKVVWHRRPLSECVGGRKADMTQNRGFIGWMQRVGIVDRKGRLVLS